MHVLLFCALALSMGMGRMNDIPRPIPEPEPVVTMVFPQDIQEMPPQEIPKPKAKSKQEHYIRTTQNEGESNAPTNADFISDRNTVASAKLAPDSTGVAAMPTLNGVNISTSELANREFKDGQINKDSALASSTAPKPEALPLEPAPMMRTPDEPPLPSAMQSENNSFAPQSRTSDTKGTISNRGAQDSVNSTATASGRYYRQVEDAIGVKWHELLDKKADQMEPGKLRVKIIVDKNGKVSAEDVSIVFNEANDALTKLAIASIREAAIPPIPQDLLTTLDNERFETEYDVVILPKP